MATRAQTPLAALLTRLLPERPGGEVTAGTLLGAFVDRRDGPAFAELVRRHGPMVLGVCFRVLRHRQDAEDACQAAFLVLARKAGTVNPRNLVGHWLHGVAFRTAAHARSKGRARRTREVSSGILPDAGVEPEADRDEVALVLDEELARLPAHYRAAVLLCDVEGRTRPDAAAHLRCPEGTVSSRLTRGRALLARRLARRGVTLSLGWWRSGAATAAVPASVVAQVLATHAWPTSPVPSAVTSLADGVIRAMTLSKVKAIGAGIVVGAALALGVFGTVGPGATAAPVPKVAEPGWMADFRTAYELKVGEYVKRVPRPGPPALTDFLVAKFHKTAGTPKEELSRKHFAEWGEYSTVFVEQDGRDLKFDRSLSSAYLKLVPEKRQGNNLLPVLTVVETVTRRTSPEVVIDPKSTWSGLLEPGRLTVNGDFVVRAGAPLDKVAAQLEAILREELKLPVRLLVKEEEQDVFVVAGRFALRPPKWREANQIDVYATEEGLNKDHKPGGGQANVENVRSLTHAGTPAEFVKFLGSWVRTRMVWDTPRRGTHLRGTTTFRSSRAPTPFRRSTTTPRRCWRT